MFDSDAEGLPSEPLQVIRDKFPVEGPHNVQRFDDGLLFSLRRLIWFVFSACPFLGSVGVQGFPDHPSTVAVSLLWLNMCFMVTTGDPIA